MPLLATARRTCQRVSRILRQGHRLSWLLGLGFTLFCLWLLDTDQSDLRSLRERLDLLVYDQRFKLLPAPPAREHRIVIVDIDEKSLAAEGQWPWSRFRLAELVDRLAEAGALVIGFDMFFPEPERNLLQELEQRVAPTALDDLRQLLAPFEDKLDGAARFAASMARTEVVLGIFFQPEPMRRGSLPAPLLRLEPTAAQRLPLAPVPGYIANIDSLQQAASGAGFFDTEPDLDGVVRRSPLVRRFGEALYPALALEMARLYLFEDRFALSTAAAPDGRYRVVTGLQMGSTHIPTDSRARVLLPYRGPAGSFPYLSATDVLHGTLDPRQRELLVNSLVLVGTTAAGLYDLHATPLQEVYPGVEIHASLLDGLLAASPTLLPGADGNVRLAQSSDPVFPRQPSDEQAILLLSMLVLGILLALLLPRLGPALLALTGLSLALALVTLNLWLWQQYRLDLSLVLPLFLVLGLCVLNMAYGFLHERFTRRSLKRMFDQYVPPAHIDAMLANPDHYGFTGESRQLTVLFADIRDFTALAEGLSAAQLKTLLNDYFTPITGIIFEHQGTIDKYVGDMVMAFWGAPLDDEAHQEHAVEAALAMLGCVDSLQPHFSSQGLPAIDIGIGLNSGWMNVGDMGSSYRRAYTVLGDAVNLGARLERLTRFYGLRLLIAEQTHDALRGWLCRLIDQVQVHGKEEAVRIYEPLCREAEADDALRARVLQHHQAWEHYRRRDWDQAQAAFATLRRQDPDSATLYDVYLSRIERLREAALPDDWTAIFRHTAR